MTCIFSENTSNAILMFRQKSSDLLILSLEQKIQTCCPVYDNILSSHLHQHHFLEFVTDFMYGDSEYLKEMLVLLSFLKSKGAVLN